MRRIAVLGASLAGISTARALRAHGYAGELTLVGAEPHRPYDRPPLSKEFLAGGIAEPDLSLEMPGEDLALRWRLGVAATRLDPTGPGGASVELADGSVVDADAVVISTGASAMALPGAPDLAGIHLLRTLEDCVALRADLAGAQHLVVVGAGFIGSEVASTARSLGLEVTVVEAAPLPLVPQLGPEMAAVVAGLHAPAGTTLICGVGVSRLIGESRVAGVELADGQVLPADVVVVGIGARPQTGWLDGSGLSLDPRHLGVLCDAWGRTAAAGVFAVGDCAAWYDEELGAHQRHEHWTSALERGPVVAATILGLTAPTPRSGRAPYFWSDQYGARIQFAGHAMPGDEVTIEEGSAEERSLLAVYRRRGAPVAVLGLDRVRPFTRWRRALSTGTTPLT